MEDALINANWYGPHDCAVCGVTIIKAAMGEGGAEFEPPAQLMKIFARGAESGNPDVVYPMKWRPHVHLPEGGRIPAPTIPVAPPA